VSTTGLGRGFGHGHPALVTYLMAGYPDRATSLACLRAAAAAGADVIELGVPYGDALADGPTISRAANAAMHGNAGGFGLAESIDLAEEFLSDPGVTEAPPLALMTYLNPMLRLGLSEAALRMRAAGIEGVIVPDMPPDVAGPWLEVAEGLDTVFLVAPTSTTARLDMVGAVSSGFVYCVSTTGITGERAELPSELGSLVEAVRAHTPLPVAVGFGIATVEQATAVARIADGVVVGSAIVRRQQQPAEVGAFIRDLAAAVRV
jgi:tryptophan synthase alpha chain